MQASKFPGRNRVFGRGCWCTGLGEPGETELLNLPSQHRPLRGTSLPEVVTSLSVLRKSTIHVVLSNWLVIGILDPPHFAAKTHRTRGTNPKKKTKKNRPPKAPSLSRHDAIRVPRPSPPKKIIYPRLERGILAYGAAPRWWALARSLGDPLGCGRAVDDLRLSHRSDTPDIGRSPHENIPRSVMERFKHGC